MWRALIVLLLACVTPALCVAGSDAALVWSAHKRKIAHVEVIGTLANGQVEVQSGSGFRVSQPYVMTSGHLFDNNANYASVRINVRFESRESAPYVAHLELKDPVVDLALLRVDAVPKESGCPFYLVTDKRAFPPGVDLFFLGFPIDGPLRLSTGTLSIEADPKLELWDTDALLNPGNSGGPGFVAGGYLVGVAKGALTQWHSGGTVTSLQGISQFVPATKLQDSEVGKRVMLEQADVRCLRAVAMNDDGSFGLSGGPLPPIDRPSRFAFAQPVSIEWKAKQPEPPPRSFKASYGYKIQRCTFEPVLVVGAEVSCEQVDAGDAANLYLKAVGDLEQDTVRRVLGRVVLDQAPADQ